MFSSHSASSSPDILAPPGDAEYLISSPFRPFPGRQSSLMSPANRRILQTPGAAKRKRSRISLSPAKSAHSIRFDDIVLPGSPTRNLNGRQRSLSPDKADENVSPWRIRVTLEATQDEQENQGTPSRKRPKSTTTTTKIPLKDSSEQTPRKRGRPRKSGALDATPIAGSPGNTPGAMNSAQKRQRGRPRKNQPTPVAVRNDEPPEKPEGEQDEQPDVDVQMVDAAPASAEPEQRSWSPLNLAGDADSDDGYDDNQLGDIPFDVPAETVETDLSTNHHNPQPVLERTYDTPNNDAIDRFHTEVSRLGDDDTMHSTPSKMPSPSRSPTRELQIPSADNTKLAGYTPMPPHKHASPTSSSPVDDGRRELNRQASASASKSNAAANEYRDFDTIMESEGFSMVSLDTLPSARQHGLGSQSKLVKGALKPFIEREENGVIRRKTNVQDRQSEEALAHSPSPDPRPAPEQQHQISAAQASSQSVRSKRMPFSPLPTKNPSPPPQQKPLLRLAKVVRAGIALKSVISNSNSPAKPGSPVPDYMEPRQRLEAMFDDLNPDSQRTLRAALGLGQVLAIRRKWMELRSPQKRAIEEELEEDEDLGTPYHQNARPDMSRTPNPQLDGAADYSSSPGAEMKRRFAEWQMEREAISRTIQMANSSQVIVVNSDDPTPSPLQSENEDNEDPWMPRRGEDRDPAEEDDYGQEDNDIESSPRAKPRMNAPGQAEEQQLVDDEDDADQDPWLPRQEEGHEEAFEEDHNPSERNDHQVERSPQLPVQEERQEEDDEEEADEEEEDYDNVEGIKYDVQRSPPMLRRDEREEPENEEHYDDNEGLGNQDDGEDDDGYEDIWQEQAQDEGNSRDSMRKSQNDVQSSPWKGDSTPASRVYSTFSPAYWVEGGRVPDLGQSRVRKLREQEADMSGLLGAEDTPNRARYYYGKSSPLSAGQGRSPQQPLSSATSQRRRDALDVEPEQPEEQYQDDYLDFSPEKDLDDDFQIDPTTRFESEMQRHQAQAEFADNASLSEVADDAGEEASVHEETLTPKNPEPANKDIQASSWYQRLTSLTPGWLKAPVQHFSPQKRQRTSAVIREESREPSRSLSRSRSRSLSEEQSINEDEYEEEKEHLQQIRDEAVRDVEYPPLDTGTDSELDFEQEQIASPEPQPGLQPEPEPGPPRLQSEPKPRSARASTSPKRDRRGSYKAAERAPAPEPRPARASATPKQDRRGSFKAAEKVAEPAPEPEPLRQRQPEPKPARGSATPNQDRRGSYKAAEKEPARAPEPVAETETKAPRLATSGYFSNAHYTLLRRLYRQAKQSPEFFPSNAETAFSHSAIIGDYIWTSDNTYGVPITELQFAIVYRFRQELAAMDAEDGGSGVVGWSEADLHRRLVSIIIGEQIREDRENESFLRPSRSRPKSILQRG